MVKTFCSILDLPKVTLHPTNRSAYIEIPSLDITFPNGYADKFCLKRYISSEEEVTSDSSLNCNFFGHLENDKEACVAVTGCPGRDNLEMTINSKHPSPSNMYILHRNGSLEMVESTFKDPRVKTESLRHPSHGSPPYHVLGDEFVNDEEVKKTMLIEALCASGSCSSLPSTNLLKIKVI